MTRETEIKEQLKQLGKKVLNILIAGLVVGCAFFAGFYIASIKTTLVEAKSQVNQLNDVKTLKDVSVAIDNSDNIIMLNKLDGTYTLYSDSVGTAIFKLYVGKIVKSVEQ